jgi:hypothetical protein
LSFGDRGGLLVEAEKRLKVVKAMRNPVTGEALWPKANLYGDTQLDGLNVLYLLTDGVDKFDTLPANPSISGTAIAWQKYLQPVGYAAAGLVVVGLGINYLVARARMIQEKEGK